MQNIDLTHFTHNETAKILYWLGWSCTEIGRTLNRPVSTIYTWRDKGEWELAEPIKKVATALELRFVQLLMKEAKSGTDFKEIDLLGRQMERFARINTYLSTGVESDLNPRASRKGTKPAKQPKRNYFSQEQIDELVALFLESLFDYQRTWHEAGDKHRIRNILKSRQIGATFYFAREAFIDGLKTGRNQIFLSASKAQAYVFREYVRQLAKEVDVDLTGDPIVVNTDEHEFTMYFLGTNARTAQSYHGNLYMDEYFWIFNFQQFRKVASGMAMHKNWRQTYFSTPSALTHDAYPFWTGNLFNRGRKEEDKIKVDISHQNLAAGKLCNDGQWRQVVTIEDAIEGGCDLFDKEQLKLEYSPDEYANLLMCEFVDDSLSVFPLAQMMGCLVDSWTIWQDFKPFAQKPLGNLPVWLGYDPSGGGDSQAVAVVVPPAVPGGKFRVVERIRWNSNDFQQQANVIKRLTKKYNVQYIGIDVTGIGHGVYQIVKQFFPRAKAITYSVDVKTEMVIKAQDVIRYRRLEYDAGWSDVTQSFMAIKKTLTGSQQRTTYVSGRSEDTGHSDVAWAIMHALANEPIEGAAAKSKNRVEMSG